MIGSYSGGIIVQNKQEHLQRLYLIWAGLYANLIHLIIFFSTKSFLNSSSKCREGVRHGDIQFRFSGKVTIVIAIPSKLLSQMYNKL